VNIWKSSERILIVQIGQSCVKRFRRSVMPVTTHTLLIVVT
jgi:hypothetical protein